MITKPKCLVGEVKSFIDEVWKHNEYPEIRPFFLQPFMLKLIAEYFNVNIEVSILNTDAVYLGDEQFGLWIYEYDKEWYVAEEIMDTDEDRHFTTILKIETLYQLITNMLQAGIKFTWKE